MHAVSETRTHRYRDIRITFEGEVQVPCIKEDIMHALPGKKIEGDDALIPLCYAHSSRHKKCLTSVVSTIDSMSLLEILFAGAALPMPMGLHFSAPLPAQYR